jgi:hypothetical protein
VDAIAGIDAALVSKFKKTYGESALLCRYPPCQRATLGFSSTRDRDKHESSHTRKFRCADSTCEFYDSGFSTKATLQKHNEMYHRKMHDFVLPIRRRQNTTDLREKFMARSHSPSRPRASIPQRPAGRRLHMPSFSEWGMTSLQVFDGQRHLRKEEMLANTNSQSHLKLKANRQQDPNEPKRPLTPISLYMRTARPIIAMDLGSEATTSNVSADGARRWKEMLWQDKVVSFHPPPIRYVS